MDTKDTRQTYKQYKERQKRIAIKKSYDDKLEQSSNKIEDLYVQLEQIKAALNNQIETRQQIRNEMHREMLRQYNKDNTIEETIELAEKQLVPAILLEKSKTHAQLVSMCPL